MIAKIELLTFDLNTFQTHGYTKGVFDTASDLFVMVGSGNVENLVIVAVLTRNLTIVNKPLVTVLVDSWIGHSGTMKSSLKKK